MEGTNILRKKINSGDGNIEGQKLEDIVDIFINSLYQPTLKFDSVGNINGTGVKQESYSIKSIIPEEKNFRKFLEINKRLVYKYANNIKKNYDNKLSDAENEYSNLYLYIVESLYRFFKNHCNEDVDLFKSYIEDSNKKYINSENKQYTFSKYMYMSVERMIKKENILYEKSLEKEKLNLNGKFARFELDLTKEHEDGKESDIELYSLGLFTELRDEDFQSDEQILHENIREMIRIQNKLLTVLTKSQMEFIVTETYGCYYDNDKQDFIMKIYTKQKKNQYINQISKRINRDIRPFYIKKHNEKYVDDVIKYRRTNRKKLDATPRDVADFIGKHTTFIRKGNIEIKEVKGDITEYIPYGSTKRIVKQDGKIEYK